MISAVVVALLPGIEELTYIGCSLSVLGTAAILITYAIFRELRTFPSLLLMNLSFAILVTNLFFVIGGPVVQHFPSAELCAVVAIFLHFFYLAQFVWMSLFSVEMAHTFYLARKMVGVAERQRRGLLLLGYVLIGWGIPLGVVLVTLALNYSGSGLVLYGTTPNGDVGNCWINHLPSFVATFLVPLLVSLFVNLGTFLFVSAVLWLSSRSKSASHQANHLVLVRVWLAVFSVTGLTWVFGFMAIPRLTQWAWYPFVLFNSTQGFLIFLAFLCTKKTFDLYLGLLKGAGRRLCHTHGHKVLSQHHGHVQHSEVALGAEPCTMFTELGSRQGSINTCSSGDGEGDSLGKSPGDSPRGSIFTEDTLSLETDLNEGAPNERSLSTGKVNLAQESADENPLHARNIAVSEGIASERSWSAGQVDPSEELADRTS